MTDKEDDRERKHISTLFILLIATAKAKGFLLQEEVQANRKTFQGLDLEGKKKLVQRLSVEISLRHVIKTQHKLKPWMNLIQLLRSVYESLERSLGGDALDEVSRLMYQEMFALAKEKLEDLAGSPK